MIRWFGLCLCFCLLLAGCSDSRPKLYLFCWGDYFGPRVIRDFEEEFGCRVVLDTYESNEAMFARLRAGSEGYDLAAPSTYFVDLMHTVGLLESFDLERLPTVKRFLDQEDPFIETEAGLQYAIPFMYSFPAVAYRESRVPNPEPTWAIFAREDLRGRMTMFNDMRMTLGAALKYLGYSINTRSEGEVEAAADLVIEWKRNLAKFESEQFKNGLATGEFLLAHSWAGDLLQLQREDKDLQLMIPREGTGIGTDFFVIPKGARNLDLAHKFIDFLYRPDIAARNIYHNAYPAPHTGAWDYLDEQSRTHPALAPPRDIMAKSEVVRDVGEALRFYIHAWERVQAAE